MSKYLLFSILHLISFNLGFLFLMALGFELRASCLLGHLNHSTSPFLCCIFFFFSFFVVLELDSRPSPWAPLPVLFLGFFCERFFEIESHELFAQAGFKLRSSWSLNSWVARITGVSHWHLACVRYFWNRVSQTICPEVILLIPAS
jgi:hypothetical protein